jgi:hypothetical protein
MKRINFVALLRVMTLFTSAGVAFAADTTGFTGKYTAERAKQTASGSAESALDVVQNESAIEITLIQSQKRTTSKCPLNGSDGDYTSPGGISGKCKAQLKGKDLIVESVVVTHPQPSSNVRVHTKERWQLSKDGKILTIKSDVDFPDFPSGVSAAASGDTSTITKYTRVNQ